LLSELYAKLSKESKWVEMKHKNRLQKDVINFLINDSEESKILYQLQIKN